MYTFSSPCKTQSCMLFSKIKYVACLLLTALLLPLATLSHGGCPLCGDGLSSRPQAASVFVSYPSFPNTRLNHLLASHKTQLITSLSSFLSGAEEKTFSTGTGAQLYFAGSCPSNSLSQFKWWTGFGCDPGFHLQIFDYVYYAVSCVCYYLLLYAHHTFLNWLITLSRHWVYNHIPALHIQFMPKPCYYGSYIWMFPKPYALIIYPVHGWYLRPWVAHAQLSTSVISSGVPHKERNT